MKKTVFCICIFLLLMKPTQAQKMHETPHPFLPEIIGPLSNVRDFARYENEIYFTLQSLQEEYSCILVIKKEKGKWTNPAVAVFSGQFIDLEPFFSKDGLRMYFASNRPLAADSREPKDFDIWYVERKTIGESWSAPVNLGSPLNTKYNEFYPCVTDSKNIYFTSDRPDSKGKDDIFVCKNDENGQLADPVSLSDSVNTAGYEFNAFISPDESFIIYTGYNRKGGSGSGDLYISYRDKKGVWGPSVSLGSGINSDKMDYCPFVDMKTKTLYFTSRRNSVKTVFEKPQALDELLKEFSKYENWLSRLYEVNIKDLIR